jgi:hypothetical protein
MSVDLIDYVPADTREAIISRQNAVHRGRQVMVLNELRDHIHKAVYLLDHVKDDAVFGPFSGQYDQLQEMLKKLNDKELSLL